MTCDQIVPIVRDVQARDAIVTNLLVEERPVLLLRCEIKNLDEPRAVAYKRQSATLVPE